MKLMDKGIKRDETGAIAIGGGLKWVIGTALVLLGLVAGNFVPRVWSETAIASAAHREKVAAYMAKDEERMKEFRLRLKAMEEWGPGAGPRYDARQAALDRAQHTTEHKRDMELLLTRIGEMELRLSQRIAKLEK